MELNYEEGVNKKGGYIVNGLFVSTGWEVTVNHTIADALAFEEFCGWHSNSA